MDNIITVPDDGDNETALSYRTLDPTQKFYLTQEEYKDMQRGIIIVAQEDEESPLNRILRDNLQTKGKPLIKTGNKAGGKGSNNKVKNKTTKKNSNTSDGDENKDDAGDPADDSKNNDDDEEDEEDIEESFGFEDNRSRFSVITNYFDCIIDGCDSKFKKKKDRNNHVRVVHKVEPYCCPIGDCKERTNNSHQYARHIVQNHPEIQQWTCEKCPDPYPKFSNYQSFWKHNYTLHESGLFGCPYKGCSFTGNVRKRVYNHVIHKHPDLKYACHHAGCDKVFSHPSEVMAHQLRAHLFLKPFKCTWPDCGYSSEVSSATLRHIRAVHFNVPSLKIQRKTNMIDTRDPREFLQRVVDPKRILACFGPIDKNDKDKMFKCSHCSQTYRRRFNLMVHERIHNGVKPFRCAYHDCNQYFVRREYAISHIRTEHFNLKSKRSKKRDRNEAEIDVNKYIEVVPEQVVQPETIIVEEENASNYHPTIVDSLQDLQGQMFFIQTTDQETQLIEIVTEDNSEPVVKKAKSDPKVDSAEIFDIQEVPEEKNDDTVDEISTQTPLTNMLIHTTPDDAMTVADGKSADQHPEEEYSPPKKQRSKVKIYYNCPQEDCGRSFSRPAALKLHSRAHNGTKPYSCAFVSDDNSYCDFTSVRKENLVQHIRTKHFNLPRSFKRQQELNIIDERDPLEYVRVDRTLLLS